MVGRLRLQAVLFVLAGVCWFPWGHLWYGLIGMMTLVRVNATGPLFNADVSLGCCVDVMLLTVSFLRQG